MALLMTTLVVRLITISKTIQESTHFPSSSAGMPDENTARRLVHTLKGSAANVGATRVQQAAQILEAAMIEPAAPERVDALVASCLAAVAMASGALESAFGSDR